VNKNSAPRIESFDHVHTELGSDGTPYDNYHALLSEAKETGRFFGWSKQHGGFWVIFGHSECIEIARQADAFSNREATFPAYAMQERFMISSFDDPEHKIQRAIVNRSFSPNSVKQYEGLIRENVNLLIDGVIESGKADLARVMARPIPALVTALLVGLPAEDGPKFSRWVASLAERHILDDAEADAATAEMYSCFDSTIVERQKNPGQDVLSQVIQATYDGRKFTHEELRGFFTILMVGGIDNSARLIGSMLWHLGWDNALRSQLVEHPELVPTAVQEFLRFYSPAHIVRQANHDIEFQGATIKKGDFVLLAYPIANRDPRTFENPDKFIPNRAPNLHLGLGIGIHRCLGAHLIALEARIVLEEFLKRLPEYAIDENLSAKWMSGQVAGMVSVPVRFTPGTPLSSQDGGQKLGVDAWLINAENKS
jgi:cytochrome P450